MHQNLGFDLPASQEPFLDIGGGYGNFYRLARAIGYGGNYSIVDFRLMHRIQRAFISANGLDRPKYLVTQSRKATNFVSGTVLATFSLTEMPWPDRERFEGVLLRSNRFLVAGTKSFDGIDNHAYLDNLSRRLSNVFKTTVFRCAVNDRHKYLLGEAY